MYGVSFDDPADRYVNVISADRRLDSHRDPDRAETENRIKSKSKQTILKHYNITSYPQCQGSPPSDVAFTKYLTQMSDLEILQSS